MPYTEQERIAARRATWQKYNEEHRAERATHNKAYVQKEDVKVRRRQTRVVRTHSIPETVPASEPVQRVDPTTEIINST